MEMRSIKSVKELRRTWNFCKSMGITQVMGVPVRKKGMTSSGIKHDCHWNVRLLTKRYGGKTVLGYKVTLVPQDRVILFHHHSVWETPEGQVVDVTDGERDEDTFSFLPLAKYDPTKESYYTRNVLFHPTEGINLYRSPENGATRIRGIPITNKMLKRKRTKVRECILGYANEPDESEGGGFTKPSTATGKYFELKDSA